MYNDVIRQLLQKIEIIPEEVVIKYLMVCYRISEGLARQAIHSAYRARIAYKKGDCLARNLSIEMNSRLMKKAKALAVMLEVTREKTDFICSSYPWLISFMYKNNLIQIGHIERNMELTGSMVMADKPVSLEERDTIKRIAIVDENCNLSRIKAAGFVYFCTVDEEFKVKIISKITGDDVWKDVPLKEG